MSDEEIIKNFHAKTNSWDILKITREAWGCKICGHDIRRGCNCSTKAKSEGRENETDDPSTV